MGVDFSKLWGILGIRRITQSELQRLVVEKGGTLSLSTLNRLRNNQHINTKTLESICQVLDVQPSEIMEITEK